MWLNIKDLIIKERSLIVIDYIRKLIRKIKDYFILIFVILQIVLKLFKIFSFIQIKINF